MGGKKANLQKDENAKPLSNKDMNTECIPLEEMKEAIIRSGYLIEQRVENKLIDHGYYVIASHPFPDPITGKSRELDLFAISAFHVYRKVNDFIFPVLICECENNKQPIVLFTKKHKELIFPEICCSGVPIEFSNRDRDNVTISDFTAIHTFHHYFKVPVATQYCTFEFKKDKSSKYSWIAFHNDEQHNTFNSLIQSLDNEIIEHSNSWVMPDDDEEESVNIQIYYPLLILQGPLYEAFYDDELNLIIQDASNVTFKKQVYDFKNQEGKEYMIDVITENYLDTYLGIVDQEIKTIKKIFQRKRKAVKKAINKYVEDAREKADKLRD